MHHSFTWVTFVARNMMKQIRGSSMKVSLCYSICRLLCLETSIFYRGGGTCMLIMTESKIRVTNAPQFYARTNFHVCNSQVVLNS